jgi:RNase P subunit RPR2
MATLAERVAALEAQMLLARDRILALEADRDKAKNYIKTIRRKMRELRSRLSLGFECSNCGHPARSSDNNLRIIKTPEAKVQWVCTECGTECEIPGWWSDPDW